MKKLICILDGLWLKNSLETLESDTDGDGYPDIPAMGVNRIFGSIYVSDVNCSLKLYGAPQDFIPITGISYRAIREYIILANARATEINFFSPFKAIKAILTPLAAGSYTCEASLYLRDEYGVGG